MSWQREKELGPHEQEDQGAECCTERTLASPVPKPLLSSFVFQLVPRLGAFSARRP